MTKNRIIGTVAALSLLAVPAVAAAHGDDAHGGHHHKHPAKKPKVREVRGTVTSFAAGALTITLPSGRSFTADVTRRTIIECKGAPVAATARHGGEGGGSGRGGRDDGPNHDAGDDHGDDASSPAPATTSVPPSTTVPAGDDAPGHDANDDHENGHGVRCGTDALVTGAAVREAKLSLRGGDATWKKVELA